MKVDVFKCAYIAILIGIWPLIVYFLIADWFKYRESPANSLIDLYRSVITDGS